MTELKPSFTTTVTVSSDPNKFGKAVGWSPAFGRGLGVRPNLLQPDAVYMPEEYRKYYNK